MVHVVNLLDYHVGIGKLGCYRHLCIVSPSDRQPADILTTCVSCLLQLLSLVVHNCLDLVHFSNCFHPSTIEPYHRRLIIRGLSK